MKTVHKLIITRTMPTVYSSGYFNYSMYQWYDIGSTKMLEPVIEACRTLGTTRQLQSIRDVIMSGRRTI